MDGNFRFRFGSPGSRDGHFQSPSGVAVTREGDIVVADTMNNRIQVGILRVIFYKIKIRPQSKSCCFKVIRINYNEKKKQQRKNYKGILS